MRAYLGVLLLAAVLAVCSSNSVSDTEWNTYVLTYSKTYPSTAAQNNARYYYAVNKGRINTHNSRYNQGLESYGLDVNQFTDMRFVDFAAQFPATTEIASNAAPYTLPNTAPQASFSYSMQGYRSPVQDQKTACNSGWAYAAATTLQIYNALNTGNLNSAVLSAQNFIDCAGASNACSNQVSQVAFDYLTVHAQRVYPTILYANRPLDVQGMCIIPPNQLDGVTLSSYSTIANANDVALRTIVNYVAPVVIKFNPGTFEFMHYKEGVFTQPAPTQTAAHYMTVEGFGTDTVSSKDYWNVQNSFGTTWGENGFIRIQRDTAKPIANSAIFPSL